jgi:hypothetical protein
LSDNYDVQWHSAADYLSTARAADSPYHGPFYLRFFDGGGEADSEVGRVLARDRTNIHCPVFDYAGISDDPANRASVLVHEGWHHWQYAKGYEHNHLVGEGDLAPGAEGDYYYFHRVYEYDFNVLWSYRLSPLLFHSPYQVQSEFDADLAECANGWVPVAVTQAARYYGNVRLNTQFWNRPGYRIGQPRPF